MGHRVPTKYHVWVLKDYTSESVTKGMCFSSNSIKLYHCTQIIALSGHFNFMERGCILSACNDIVPEYKGATSFIIGVGLSISSWNCSCKLSRNQSSYSWSPLKSSLVGFRCVLEAAGDFMMSAAFFRLLFGISPPQSIGNWFLTAAAWNPEAK